MDFSSIDTDSGYQYLHLAGGNTYRFGFNTTAGDSNLINYSLNDIRFEFDNSTSYTYDDYNNRKTLTYADADVSSQGAVTYLSDMTWDPSSYVGYGSIQKDKNTRGTTITLKGSSGPVTYTKGLGVHAVSSVKFSFGGNYKSFISDIGVDQDSAISPASVTFQVIADGVPKYTSSTMYGGTTLQSINVDVTGVQTLELYVGDGNGSISSDHADWAGARLESINKTQDVSSYSYDYNGNQTSVTKQTTDLIKGTTGAVINLSSNQYNGFNQLISETSNGQTATYTYNGDGLRTSKTIGAVTTSHIWDGDQIAFEYDSAGNGTKYIRGINLIAAENVTGTIIRKYYLYNGHGDVIQLTDNTGNVIKNYEYDAFGNEKQLTRYGDVNNDGLINSNDITLITNFVNNSATAPFTTWNGFMAADVNGDGSVNTTDVSLLNNFYAGQIDSFPADTNKDGYASDDEVNTALKDNNVFRYCGEYFDKETGTIYLRARYYNPAIGRFITEDSYWGKSADPLSLNLYTYCGNSPIIMVDPSGHETNNISVFAKDYGGTISYGQDIIGYKVTFTYENGNKKTETYNGSQPPSFFFNKNTKVKLKYEPIYRKYESIKIGDAQHKFYLDEKLTMERKDFLTVMGIEYKKFFKDTIHTVTPEEARESASWQDGGTAVFVGLITGNVIFGGIAGYLNTKFVPHEAAGNKWVDESYYVYVPSKGLFRNYKVYGTNITYLNGQYFSKNIQYATDF